LGIILVADVKLVETCLTYKLEDNVDFKERGNDMILIRSNDLTGPRRDSLISDLSYSSKKILATYLVSKRVFLDVFY